ncbi:MAG: cold-shock protein [Thermoleophilia bacterium]|nr:cold-shock protein [Thermoleophilia bacterium]
MQLVAPTTFPSPSPSPSPASPRPVPGDIGHGSVLWYNAEKGFGFLSPDDGASPVFAHYSQVEAPKGAQLHEGDTVSWTYALGAKGFAATHISIESAATGAALLDA